VIIVSDCELRSTASALCVEFDRSISIFQLFSPILDFTTTWASSLIEEFGCAGGLGFKEDQYDSQKCRTSQLPQRVNSIRGSDTHLRKPGMENSVPPTAQSRATVFSNHREDADGRMSHPPLKGV
jgi:hypothetical protein